MPKEKIYVELSPEIQEWLADNRLTIEDLLDEKNIAAEVTYGEAPYQIEDGVQTRDIVPIILAGSAAVISISIALSQILETLYSKPILMETFDIQASRDVDRYGRPLLKLVKRYELLEPRQEEKTKEIEVSFLGFVIRVKTHKGGSEQSDE